eukprot:6088145-Pyramimonas_sp.AAC.1
MSERFRLLFKTDTGLAQPGVEEDHTTRKEHGRLHDSSSECDSSHRCASGARCIPLCDTKLGWLN